MFIAILSVKLKFKAYIQIHKMAVKYWDVIAQGLELTPISVRQLRERLKKTVISLENQQRSFFSYFLSLSKNNIISADKMMNKAKSLFGTKSIRTKALFPRTCGVSTNKRLGVNQMPMVGFIAMVHLH